MRGSRAAAPKGTKSCRRSFVYLSVCPFVRPPQALLGLKSALSGLKSTLSGLKSALPGLESERADLRPERADFRLERADQGLRGLISGLRGQISGLRGQISGLRGPGGTNKWINRQTNERTKVPLCFIGLHPLRGRCPKRMVSGLPGN